MDQNENLVEQEAKEQVTIKVKDWKVSSFDRGGGKCKIIIKLNKEESNALKNFTEITKPPNVSDEDFMKSIFVMGYETMHERLTRLSEAYVKEQQEKGNIPSDVVTSEDLSSVEIL